MPKFNVVVMRLYEFNIVVDMPDKFQAMQFAREQVERGGLAASDVTEHNIFAHPIITDDERKAMNARDRKASGKEKL